jgi:hypothetical protein
MPRLHKAHPHHKKKKKKKKKGREMSHIIKFTIQSKKEKYLREVRAINLAIGKQVQSHRR